MNEKDLAELREHFDSTDLSHSVESAAWENDVDPDPMIVTSLRLPKSLLDWVREQAEVERVKPTTLIRRWIEDRRPAPSRTSQVTLADLAARIDRLESVTLRVVGGGLGPAADGGQDDGMKDLLAALRRSVDAAGSGAAPDEGLADEARRGA